MNKTTSVWAYRSETRSNAELIQRIAFSFGYKWSLSDTPSYLEARYFYFDPATKEITYGVDDGMVTERANRIAYTLKEAMELFKNPPEVEPSSLKVGSITLFKDGTLRDGNGNLMKGEDFEKLVAERENFLGKRKPAMYPMISFEYKGECSTYCTKRRLVVIKSEESFVEGYELSGAQRNYKRFLFNRMHTLPVFLGLRSLE